MKESVSLIMGAGIDYEFRTTAVKGIHTRDDFEKIGEFIKGAKKYYIQQFIDSGDLISGGMSAFSAEETKELLDAVLPFVPSAEMRGL
jgi:pyruvate formate lyase activating enzyme